MFCNIHLLHPISENIPPEHLLILKSYIFMNKKTKILAIGDIHGDTGLVKRLAKKAKDENVDLIIPGNHESKETIDFLAEKYPNTKSIHGYSLRRGNLGIFGSGTIDWGIDSGETRKLFKDLERGHEKIKDANKKIMVTHMHHRGGKAEFSGFLGSSGVKKAIKEFHPDILISAHIHEAGGIEEQIGETKIINVSRRPKIFEI